MKTLHGLSRTPEYRVWQTMVHRCTSPTSHAWEDYGGRGITVCARWLGSVRDFVADMGRRPAGHEIDRKNNDGGYWCGKCPECRELGRPANCHWTTRSENDRNRRNNTLLTFSGETLTLVEWSARTGVARDVISHRLRSGWTIERALTKPSRGKAPNGTAAKRCRLCKGRGAYSVHTGGEHGWTRVACECARKAA